MPSVPREGGWSNYTASQSVTGSYSQCIMCDSLSNTASVPFFFFFSPQHEATPSVCQEVTVGFWCVQTESKENFLPFVTHSGLIMGSFIFIHIMVHSYKRENYRINNLCMACRGVQLHWTLRQFHHSRKWSNLNSTHARTWPTASDLEEASLDTVWRWLRAAPIYAAGWDQREAEDSVRPLAATERCNIFRSYTSEVKSGKTKQDKCVLQLTRQLSPS